MLPQPAERLDALMPCQSTEMEIAVECLHVDAGYHVMGAPPADMQLSP